MRAVFSLLLAILLVPLATLQSAGQSSDTTATVSGAWAGWVEVAGNFQPLAVSLTPGNTPPGTTTNLLSGVSRPLGAVIIDGARVRLEPSDQRAPVLVGTLERHTISGTAETRAGRSGAFRLMRTAALDPAAKRRYVGAYRFDDGRFLLVDIGYPPGSEMLYAVDASSGEVRAMYPASPTEFVSGPALLVLEPTEQTLSFEIKGEHVTGVVRRRANGVPERARRVEIREEDVRFHNGDTTLAGTALIPSTGDRHRGLVFAHGGGATPREMFWGFGYLLAARGFVVLAFDKRGTGQSTGDWRTASFDDLADDVVAGARWLQSRPDVAKERIGFWGLSQGAWIAPLAAVRFGDDASYVITLSGGGLTPAAGELFDSEYEMRKARFAEQDVRDGLAFQRAKNEFMRTGANWSAYATLLQQANGRPWWRLPGTDLSGPSTSDDVYWTNNRRFYFYDPTATLRRLRAPLLAIFGELDSPDGVTANVKEMTAALASTTQSDYTIRVFANGRHNLMDLDGFDANEYSRLKRFVPGLFDAMASWLERH